MTPDDDPVCEYCNSYMSDHDWEHLARYCYPLKLDKERRDHAQALAAAKAEVWEEAMEKAKQFRCKYGEYGVDYSHFMAWCEHQAHGAQPKEKL